MTTLELITTDDCATSKTYLASKGHLIKFKSNDSSDNREFLIEYPNPANRFMFKTGLKYRISFRGSLQRCVPVSTGLNIYKITRIVKIKKI